MLEYFLCFTLKVECDLFKMCNRFAKMLLTNFSFVGFQVWIFFCLELNRCWKFNVTHWISSKSMLYSLCNIIACLYIIMLWKRKFTFNMNIDCILYTVFCVNLNLKSQSEKQMNENLHKKIIENIVMLETIGNTY